MIGWLITSRFGRALAGAGALIAAFMTTYIAGGRSARRRAAEKALRDSLERQERGRDEVRDLRGADRDALDQRLRDNDGRW